MMPRFFSVACGVVSASENRKSWFLIFLLKLTCSTKAKAHFYLLILYVTVITKHFYFIISDFKLKNQNMF